MKFEIQLIGNIDASWNTVHTTLSSWDFDNNVDAFDWCTAHPSDGGFYFGMFAWYFEHKEDALLFTLMWGT